MRGEDQQQDQLFSYGSMEERIPADHPLRAIREMVDRALKEMSGRFDEIYDEDGRKSIAPERLLRALLLQMLYSIRSERMLMEQLRYNWLFRWFVGLSADEPVWHATVFSKNRDRLLEGVVADEFFSLIVAQARAKKLLSDEHFTVDGTLIEAWAGQKSFQRKKSDEDNRNPPRDPGSNPTVNWHKEERSNETHESVTDPLARLFKKTGGAEARLCYLGHLLTENRHGLVVDVRLTQASGTAERDAAADMIGYKPAGPRVTLGGDKGYDTRGFVKRLREMHVTPHLAQNVNRSGGSAIDARTTRHEGYSVSQRKRKRVEEVFGWMKTIALQRKTRFRGTERVGWMFTLAAAAYNLVRMRNLQAATA